MEPKSPTWSLSGGFVGGQISTTDPRRPVVEKRNLQKLQNDTDVPQYGAGLVENGITCASVVDPSGVLASSLFPEPVCNAIQEFVPAIELLEYGFPVSSPSGDEHSGASASSAATTTIT